MRAGQVVLVATLALMPATHDHTAWFVLRFAAGAASALVFVIAVSAMLTHLRRRAHHLVGWGFGGVGVGIALSGLLVLITRSISTWSVAWWFSAVLALTLTALAWRLAPAPASEPAALQERGDFPRTQRWFAALFAAYRLEGVGYIIAGTFLVAAIGQNSSGWVGTGAWVLVGLAAVPASAMWATFGHRWTRPSILVAALLIQAVGIGLPAVVGGVAAALIAAILFGSTFLGIASLVLALGAHLQVPRAVALLTTGYSIGQMLGPLIVTPLLHNGYRDALLAGAALVLAATMAAAALRVKFPHRVGNCDKIDLLMAAPAPDEARRAV